MYAMNLVISDSYTSSSEDFYTVYKEANNGNMIDRASYKTDLKESIAMTLTKQFYGNFVNYAASGTYNLEQLMHMMSIYEDELSRLLWYSNSSYRDSYIDFFEFYIPRSSHTGQKYNPILLSYSNRIQDIFFG